MILDIDANTTTAYIRVVSLSIAFYDYILTLPAEWRFYKSQRSWRLSPGCMLFIAIRYCSVIVILLSNIGYFGRFFTEKSCPRYYLAAPIFKVLQTMISQSILGIRTINISRRSTWVTWTIIVAFAVVTTAEWFLNLYNRVPIQGKNHNCTAGNSPPILTTWLYYVAAMVYDLITLGISTIFLVGFGANSGKMARLVKIMLTDGLLYFVALTGVNVLNLILYRNFDEHAQSAGVSLEYALTWIMSQRILIHLRDAAAAHNRVVTTQIVVSRALPSALSVSQAMRSQFESKDRAEISSAFDLDWSYASSRNGGAEELTGMTFESKRSRKHVGGMGGSGSASASGSTSRKERGGKRGRSQAEVREAEGSTEMGSVGASERGSRRTSQRDRERTRTYDGRDGYISEEDSDDRIDEEEEEEAALSVQVQIEEMVTVEYDPQVLARESYRSPRLLWPGTERRHSGRGSAKTSTGEGGAAGT